jgi:hypothetical protein
VDPSSPGVKSADTIKTWIMDTRKEIKGLYDSPFVADLVYCHMINTIQPIHKIAVIDDTHEKEFITTLMTNLKLSGNRDELPNAPNAFDYSRGFRDFASWEDPSPKANYSKYEILFAESGPLKGNFVFLRTAKDKRFTSSVVGAEGIKQILQEAGVEFFNVGLSYQIPASSAFEKVDHMITGDMKLFLTGIIVENLKGNDKPSSIRLYKSLTGNFYRNYYEASGLKVALTESALKDLFKKAKSSIKDGERLYINKGDRLGLVSLQQGDNIEFYAKSFLSEEKRLSQKNKHRL